MRFRIALVTSLTMLASLLPALPAAAACPSSNGSGVPDLAAPAGDVVFHGRGLGHGMGMSQYGANGAAKLGCSHRQILERYYPGASLTTDSGRDEVVVGLVDPRHQTRHSAGIEVITTTKSELGRRDVAWQVTDCATASNCDSQPPAQGPGEVWQMIPDGKGRFRLYRVVGGTRESKPFWTGGQAGARLVVAHEGTVVTVRPLIGGKLVNGRTVRWGQLEMLTTGNTVTSGVATSYVRQRVTKGPDLDGGSYQGLERYLWGLGEVPSTFELAAQRAQAVAARTYALRKIRNGPDSRCKCDLVTTPKDQNYTGWSKESEDLDFGRRWRDQVIATQREVMKYNGSLITALYSSSHGGHTESPTYVWGTSNPGYLTPIDDSRWDVATDKTKWDNSKNRSWVVGFTWAQLASKLDFDKVTDIAVGSPIGSTSRHKGVRVSGVKNGQSVSESWTGWDVRQALGLKSPNFLIEVVQDLSRDGIPITGDWDGNGTDDLGWYRDGDVALRLPDGVIKRFRYGTEGDIPIIGDFDGDGIDTVSIIRDREWHINNRPQTGGAAQKKFVYGRITAGDKPLAGDWDGNGVDDVGIVRRGEWHLRTDVNGGPGQIVFIYGRVLSGDIPVTGDWLGRGSDQIGIVRGDEWHLRYALAGGPADRVFKYGDARLGDYPVAADFDANSTDTTGIVRDQVWYIRNDLRGGSAQVKVRFKG